MVEFRFDISPLFSQPIVKVTSNLLPHTFRGDRRQCLDATSKMSEIIDRLGQLSANAQKLNTPVTTAQRLRMSENQTIYLLADVNAGNNGAVIGLLKVGTKDLYLFDETGQTRKVENAPCILDFYIHESRQRAGLGKDLFETMLADEKWTPIKCSVDRPSEKLLGFLRKHYGLVRSIPQSNNFVLYEGFFDDDDYNVKHTTNGGGGGGNGMYITNSPNTQLFGATYLGDENNKRRSQRHLEAASNMTSQITQISPVGRYGARRPTCSMAEKNSSEISLTPSQLAEEAKVVARKNPLDALSKTNVRQSTMERRSGLQDVDEEYLKQNVFRKPQFQRNSGLNEMNSFQQQIANPSHAAGQPSISHGEQAQLQQQHSHPPTQQQQQQINQQQSPSTVVTNQNASQITVGQPTSAAGSLPAESKININQAPMSMGQQQQQQQQVPSMMTSTMSQQQVPVPHHHHHHHQQHHQHQQHSGQHLHHRQHEHHHQTPSAMPTPTIVQSVMPEPEMCTTCPNCQTTIYLVPAPATLGHSQQTTYESSSSAAAAQPEIIHSGTTPTKGAESGSDQQTKVDFVLENLQNLQIEDNNETSAPAEPELPQNEPNDIEEDLQTQPDVDVEPEVSTDLETNTNTTNMDHATEQEPSNSQQNSSSVAQSPSEENHKPAPTFHLSKQHTGMKNRSYGVGMAVTPTNKMEFDQESREDFGVVKINRPVGSKCAMSPSGSHPGGDDAMSTVSSGGEGLTDQGYNDLKFYHNKLW